jgi:hypothetical protein
MTTPIECRKGPLDPTRTQAASQIPGTGYREEPNETAPTETPNMSSFDRDLAKWGFGKPRGNDGRLGQGRNVDIEDIS